MLIKFSQSVFEFKYLRRFSFGLKKNLIQHTININFSITIGNRFKPINSFLGILLKSAESRIVVIVVVADNIDKYYRKK